MKNYLLAAFALGSAMAFSPAQAAVEVFDVAGTFDSGAVLSGTLTIDTAVGEVTNGQA